VENFGSL